MRTELSFYTQLEARKNNLKKTDGSVVKKGGVKKGGIEMKSHKTADEITKVDKTKKRNAELSESTEAAGAEPKSVNKLRWMKKQKTMMVISGFSLIGPKKHQ